MQTIQRGQVLRLSEGEGAQIEVKQGCVWVTQHRDREDYIVTSGRSLRVSRPGATVISALKAAVLEIRFAPEAA